MYQILRKYIVWGLVFGQLAFFKLNIVFAGKCIFVARPK